MNKFLIGIYNKNSGLLLFIAILLLVFTVAPNKAYAQCQALQCQQNCQCATDIERHHEDIRTHVTDGFALLRERIVVDLYETHIYPALLRMTTQLNTTGIQQVEIIGTFFDAKHQLETQRLFQELTAQAHKDYHPSEGLCEIGTNVRALAGSERNGKLTQIALANRMMDRQLMAGEQVSMEGIDSDRRGRLYNFIDNYCDPNDNATNNLPGLALLCGIEGGPKARRNADVNYTHTIDNKLTLDVNFNTLGASSPDEEDVFAISANLFAHSLSPTISDLLLADVNYEIKDASFGYLDGRAIAAKRSVAQNSFAAIAAMKGSGNPAYAAPYLKSIVQELGVAPEVVEGYLGGSPSYFAQMEVLTKVMYQNPDFYTELYDKPVNVERKGAILQAIGLMQDRDIYQSLIRSEAVLSTLLATLIHEEQDRINSDLKTISMEGNTLQTGDEETDAEIDGEGVE